MSVSTLGFLRTEVGVYILAEHTFYTEIRNKIKENKISLSHGILLLYSLFVPSFTSVACPSEMETEPILWLCSGHLPGVQRQVNVLFVC